MPIPANSKSSTAKTVLLAAASMDDGQLFAGEIKGFGTIFRHNKKIFNANAVFTLQIDAGFNGEYGTNFQRGFDAAVDRGKFVKAQSGAVTERVVIVLANAFDMVTDMLCDLTRRCIDAGADGIYYACLGAEKDLFTAEEYHEFVKPYELRVFEAAASAPCCNTLHICKSGLDISRYKELPAHVVNWAIHENNPSLEEGAEIFADKVILGGLDDRAGVLVDGTKAEIETEVHKILDQMRGRRFILGADCTLPTEIANERMNAAVEACESYAASH